MEEQFDQEKSSFEATIEAAKVLGYTQVRTAREWIPIDNFSPHGRDELDFTIRGGDIVARPYEGVGQCNVDPFYTGVWPLAKGN